MSWIFGGSQKKQVSPEEEQKIKDENLKQQLGFDPNSISDISTILKNQTLDASSLHPLAGLEKELEYLDLEDEQLSQLEGTGNGILPSRGWTDDLCYGTGAVYVLGLGVGGGYGFLQGLKNIPQPKIDPITNELRPVPFKLKLNTILNTVTKHGPYTGNSAGVLAMTYNLVDAILDNVRGKHDDLNSLAAGFVSGAVFKSSAGIKPMGISAGLMTVMAAAWCGFKRAIN
ncbi:hypothetical protein BVG19_g5326 [[Candida] boidinii]|nr:hypothetical protein BVG19_g5326 [[Candida] boidinii]OWB51326.1 hypothetical protein B5S27_g2886 [[Candida] boidinii]OWB67125.1 hypothetical protein B5S30_g2479 [[Candida] boidinii]OWB86615.1 hypothetical protein B5S33_g5320 [[Candida] boidinii]GMF49794.1 unnamed protein product [[Candida] boidinii]